DRGIAEIAEHMAEIRRSEEAGREVVTVVLDITDKALYSLIPHFFRQHIEFQRQRVSSLRAGDEAAVRRDILAKKGRFDLFQKGRIGRDVLLPAQYIRGIDQQLGGVSIEALRDQVFVRDGRTAVVVVERPVEEP